MSTRNDQDEPLATGDEGASPEPLPTPRDSADVAPRTPAAYADRSADDRGRGGREVSGGAPRRLQSFVAETRAEMHRVSWPSATEVKNTTIITIVAVLFFAAYLFVVDRGFTYLIEGLTSLLSRVV